MPIPAEVRHNLNSFKEKSSYRNLERVSRMNFARTWCGATLATVLLAAAGPAMAGSDHGHWTYEGDEGPSHWGELSPEFEMCGKGRMQSPIDVAGANEIVKVSVSMSYQPVPLTIFNNGHTVQAQLGGAGSILVGGKKFHLLQVHFHTPSEHVVSGLPYPLEAHFVHRAADGALAVIGVFVREGKENKPLAALLRHAPKQKADPQTYPDVSVDPSAFIPKTGSFYRYMGSLTTPPCSEGVNWFVVEQPIEASKAQIGVLREAEGMNARPAQPANNRLILAPR